MITLRPVADAEFDAFAAAAAGRLSDRWIAAGLPAAHVASEMDRILRLEPPDPAHSLRRIVVANHTAVGSVWIRVVETGDAWIIEADVPAEVAADAVRALRPELRGLGVKHVDLGVPTGDSAMAAIVSGFEATHLATHMLQDLSGDTGSASRVTLRPMTDQEMASYAEESPRLYAAERLRAGDHDTLEEALAFARKQYDDLFPGGRPGPGHELFTASHGDAGVGHLWLFAEGEWAFIYDIEMLPEVRGKGYGTEVLALAADRARELGASYLALNVFGHNLAAQRLYERVGFATTRRFYRLAL